jgi:hypothetical protein
VKRSILIGLVLAFAVLAVVTLIGHAGADTVGHIGPMSIVKAME